MAGRTANRLLQEHQRDVDPTKHFAEFIRKPAHKPLGMTNLWITPQAHKHPQCSVHLTHTHPHTAAGSPCIALEGLVWTLLQTAGEHAQKAGLTARFGESTQTGAVNTILGKASERVSALSLALQDERKHMITRIPTP